LGSGTESHGGPAQSGPWLSRAGLWGAGEWPCCGISGAGTDGLGGLTWSLEPWEGGGNPGGAGQGQEGLWMPPWP